VLELSNSKYWCRLIICHWESGVINVSIEIVRASGKFIKEIWTSHIGNVSVACSISAVDVFGGGGNARLEFVLELREGGVLSDHS
jgi:hypothetical protein